MNRTRHAPRKSNSGVTSGVKILIMALCCVVIIGIFFSVSMVPDEYITGHSTNSIINTAPEKRSLKQRLFDWLPQHHIVAHEEELLPDWNKEFWTPIDVEVSPDPMIILCKLNFKKYNEAPHLSPMFKDLEGMSQCYGSNRKREKMSVLLKEIDDQKKSIVPPTGFVFHESRVGSTLVANFLASDPWSMVFSESTPVANALLHCWSCTRDQHIKLIRDVVKLMGQSPFHKRLFFKFQSITVTKMDIVLEAFPNTPWAFVYRNPIQTLMSHLDPKKGSNAAPCLRSMRNPPAQVSEVVFQATGKTRGGPNEAWCAAHLNMLCTMALRAYENYGNYSDSSGSTIFRGILINYDSLPGFIPQVLLPLFGTYPSDIWLAKMTQESKYYSKSRNAIYRLFFGDSKDKEDRATENIQLYGKKILSPTFELLESQAARALSNISPIMHGKVILQTENEVSTYDWKAIGPIPVTMKHPAISRNSLSNSSELVDDSEIDLLPNHSSFKEHDFVPWAPFANHHNSRRIEAVHCPMIPEPGYPKAFSMLDMVNNWNTDNTEIPPVHYDALCHFNYRNQTQLEQVYAYRAAEVPFVVYNIPELDEVVRKWNDLDYLSKLLGKKPYRTETSISNHFMYWRNAGGSFLRTSEGKKWKPPTDVKEVRFEDWIELAVKGQNKTLESRTHQYFRVSSDAGNPWLFNELPFFKPKKSMMIVNPRDQRGIHCRFGMRSVIAEAHFDGSRNAVVMLGGLRRWILTHPDQCVNMHMLPQNHPSGRHSAVDWSNPDIEKYPNFAKVVGNEVILQPGDYLYVPTYWIHYIVSLNVNFQCNTRSGTSQNFNSFIKECGF
eukprot:gene7811-10609_t